MSPLEADNRPLFFALDNAQELHLTPPANRRGEAIRVWARSLALMQKEALVTSSRTGRTWRLASDEGSYLMGNDAAPCPLSFFTVGLIASFMNEVQALAKLRSIEISNVRLTQDNYYTMTGSALRGTMVGGALPVSLHAEIDSPSDQAALIGLLHDAVAASPVSGLMRPRHDSRFTLTHNGRSVETAKVAPTGGSAEPDLGEHFGRARPSAGVWLNLVTRDGMTPKTHETTSSEGSSLAEHQDRRLHVEAVCTVRADGVKQIEQRLYNPQGSIFRFLSDETGRAPEATTFASAGIAFCFLTQFGRYAKIAKKSVDEYRIVQDTHFSLGGASGGTRQAGVADSVETHVHLKTGEADEFAQQALDMSEQTCFLHALCRTALKTNIGLLEPGKERFQQ